VDRLFIVQKGVVNGAEADAQVGLGWALTLSAGECFPMGALLAKRPTRLDYVAATDTFCYQLPATDFEHLLDLSRPFREFATRRLASLVEQSRRSVQKQYTSRISDVSSLGNPLRSIIRRAPVTVSPDTPVRAVLERMKALRIGSVLVSDDDGRPLGIFTERDVLDRIALGGLPQDAPISQAMTPSPFALPGHAFIFEAAQAMARHGFRHVLVMEEGRLLGVVSERDLFELQRLSPGEVAKAIQKAETVESLAHAALEVRRIATALLAQGLAAEQLTQLVTALNDALTSRALDLSAARTPPPDVPWCWIGLGSEGRKEQTLATDQDNALVFLPPPGADVEVLRAAFLAFAHRTNGALDACGFPLCAGDIMARNPRWCLTLEEWKALFDDWIRNGSPEALMNGAIFFDFRPLHGTAALAEQLRAWLNQQVARQPKFLYQMARNALQIRPPLRLLRDFVTDDDEFPGTIDLKKFGSRPFVDAARIFSLSHGVSVTGTAERIRLAGPKMHMHGEETEAIVAGFHFIQLLRLRNQEAGADLDPAGSRTLPLEPRAHHPNRVDPSELNDLDRRILREALRQARKLQNRLDLDFRA
jgi:CBS domain-containing protein